MCAKSLHGIAEVAWDLSLTTSTAPCMRATSGVLRPILVYVTLGVYPRNKTDYILIPYVKHRYAQICMVCLACEELCEAFTYTSPLTFSCILTPLMSKCMKMDIYTYRTHTLTFSGILAPLDDKMCENGNIYIQTYKAFKHIDI